MTPILFASAIHVVFGILMSVTAVFLMLIVLVQRGRGGGLAGAFGGAGGQSAFGTKAGDLFTRITIGVAVFWILLCLVALRVLGTKESRFGAAPPSEGLVAPADSDDAADSDDTDTGEADDSAAPADGLGAGTDATSGEGGGSGEPSGEGAGSSAPAASDSAPAAEDTKKD